MEKSIKRFVSRDVIFVMVVLLISAGLFLFVGPKGPEGVTASARIIEMEDNTELKGGWLKIGWQKMTARILRGPYRGEKITVDNGLVGNLM